jgi:succinoglycan biosynthesis transport protein ExoP
MSHPNRNPRSISAKGSDLIPSTASPISQEVVETPFRPSRGNGLSARLIWRAVCRHWWQGLLLWMLGSAGLVALVHSKVRPSFEAVSTIKVDPGEPGQSRDNGSMADFEVFKETQVRRVTNPNVIASALADHPDLLAFPGLASARDPEAEIRKSLSVGIIPRTNLIQVSMTSEVAEEAPAIVNAVIEAYLKVALDTTREDEARKRARKLRDARDDRAQAVRQKREAIAELVKRTGTADGKQARDRNSVTVEQYSVLTRQSLETDLALVESQARLDQLKVVPSLPALADPNDPDPEVVNAFYANPQVAEARSRFEKARESLADADKVARAPTDPSRTAARKQFDDCQRQLDVFWTRMKPGLLKARQAILSHESERQELEANVATLKTRLGQLNDRLEMLNVQTKAAGADELTLEFARQDLVRSEAVFDTVTKNLDQVEFEAREPVARFSQEYQAKPAASPDANHRLKAMTAGPLGMLLGVLACLVLVELRAGRVHDPDDLPNRLKLPVLGVVPPLPKPRSNSGELSTRDEIRSRRDLTQFIQSLDHLRVAICSGRDAQGRARRSIIITSACGSEGKTTLAAQLAERCVNAGLLTLLVDADIRNPSLSRMFDHSQSRGLVNVLKGEAMAEEAISVIGGAGGFHFLPAGSPRVDPSRLLHGDRMARLLASARESFDMVIVDCPPILPVPDALTIGRWVDGAVLAVRYDNSRYPLVERANRRLLAVGVPVIGAVMNGVRGGEGAYYEPYGSAEDGQDAPTY